MKVRNLLLILTAIVLIFIFYPIEKVNAQEVEYLFIGDSRMVGVKEDGKAKKDSTYNSIKFVCKSGVPVGWALSSSEAAKSEIEGISNKSKVVVVYELGVNSCGKTTSTGETAAKNAINEAKKIKNLGFKSVLMYELPAVNNDKCSGYSCREDGVKGFNDYIHKHAGDEGLGVIKTSITKNTTSISSDGLHFKDYSSMYEDIVKGLGNTSNGKGTISKSNIVGYALSWNGKKDFHYQMGGPGGRSQTLEECKTTDCSGFCSGVYSHFDISIPAQSESIKDAAKSTTTKQEEALPGDICWWNGHVAIYIGDDKIVHISTSDSNAPGYYVHVTKLSEYSRAMNGKTTTYCRMVDDISLLGEGMYEETSEKVSKDVEASLSMLTESDLTGMPIESTLKAEQEIIKLYGTADLTLKEANSLSGISENMKLGNQREGSLLGTVCSLLGIFILIYGSLLVVGTIFDATNNWLDFSLLGVLSFNRWFLVSKYDVQDGLVKLGYDKSKNKTYMTCSMLSIRIFVVILIGGILVMQLPVKLVLKVLYNI